MSLAGQKRTRRSSCALVRFCLHSGRSQEGQIIVAQSGEEEHLPDRPDVSIEMKAFEQCAGFLRIRGGEDPLDASGVHPEAYPVVRRIIAAAETDIGGLIGNTVVLRPFSPKTFVDDSFDLPTVTDILRELEKPGRAGTAAEVRLIRADEFGLRQIGPGGGRFESASRHSLRRNPCPRAKTPGTPISTLSERRSILQHPIDVQVDVLVVEAEQVFDLRALGNWRRITPHDVLDELVAHPSRPVARHSFIRAARERLGGLEQIHAHVQLRNVITGRQSSLEEEHGSASFTHCHSIDLRAHLPRAVQRVDPCVRISRMNEDLLILLEPRVHLIPVKVEAALQCG
jgi:HHH domain